MVIHALAFIVAVSSQHTKPSTSDTASVKKFVQAFYDWYTPRALKGDAEMLTLKVKADAFAPEIRKALLEDRKAQEKVKDEVVGLDFDPFLNSQDVANTYTVKKVEHKGKSWLASVYGHYKGQKEDPAPSVIAQVEKGKSGWRFTNFIYPDPKKPMNLLQVLSELKKEREHSNS